MNTPPKIHIVSTHAPDGEPFEFIKVFHEDAEILCLGNDFECTEGDVVSNTLVALARLGSITLSADTASLGAYPVLSDYLGIPEPETAPKLVELKFEPAPQGSMVYCLRTTCDGVSKVQHFDVEDTRRLDHDVVDNFIISMKIGAIRLQADVHTCKIYPQLGYELTEGGN